MDNFSLRKDLASDETVSNEFNIFEKRFKLVLTKVFVSTICSDLLIELSIMD